MPSSGTSQKAATNVPAMLPAVDIGEEAARRAPEPFDGSRREPHRDRSRGREHDADGREQRDRREQRIEARPGIPGDDLLDHPGVETGTSSTSAAPSVSVPVRRYGVGKRSESTPPAQ